MMKIWEVRSGPVGEAPILVFSDDDDLYNGLFKLNGKTKSWSVRPKVEVNIDKRRARPKLRADVSYLAPGSLVLNAKARVALDDFFVPFAQLLELDCSGQPEYFLNVTNLVDCLDREGSKKRDGSSAIERPLFLESLLPPGPQIFKVPETVHTAIYANQMAIDSLVELAAGAGVTGLRFVEPGQRPY